MKWIVGFVALGLLGYVAAGPFITIHQIKTALVQQDSEALSSCIDFPALRTNLKEQFNGQMLKTAAHDLKDNPFGALGMALASTLLDGMVNSFVTPAGLANLMAGRNPQPSEGDRQAVAQRSESSSPQTAHAQGTYDSNDQKQEPLRNARYTYDGLSKFSAWVRTDKDQDIRFVFTRDGLSWRLSNILIPDISKGESSSGTAASAASTEAASDVPAFDSRPMPNPAFAPEEAAPAIRSHPMRNAAVAAARTPTAQIEAEAADVPPQEQHNISDSNAQFATWKTQIQARMQRVWLKPPSARAGVDCIVYVTQTPNGEVTNARLGECNGDAAIRQSIKAAAFRASPLPSPPDPALFERNLEIQFKPVN